MMPTRCLDACAGSSPSILALRVAACRDAHQATADQEDGGGGFFRRLRGPGVRRRGRLLDPTVTEVAVDSVFRKVGRLLPSMDDVRYATADG